MARSHRSPHPSDDLARQRLAALAECLSSARTPEPAAVGAASNPAADPPPDPPLIGPLPAPPYASDEHRESHLHSGGADTDEPEPAAAGVDTDEPGTAAAGVDTDEPEPAAAGEHGPTGAPPGRPPVNENATPPAVTDSGKDASSANRFGPAPPPGYIEVDDDLTRRSWFTALRDRIPLVITEQPRLSRSGLHALVAVCVVAVIVGSWFYLRARPSPEPAPEGGQQSGAEAAPSGAEPASEGAASASAQPTGEVMVHVDGEVDDPGVVTLPAGSRVADAIDAAGGADSGTATESLNLARPLVDGEQVLVGVTPPPDPGAAGGQAPSGPAEPGAAEAGEPLVDLNAASPEELEELPGVGPVLAERIVEYRTTNGGFTEVEQLNDVSGIGEVRYGELNELVQVSGAE